jgi:hypothetical protein
MNGTAIHYLRMMAEHPVDKLRISPHNIQPPRTIIIDIKGGGEEILARMKQKRVTTSAWLRKRASPSALE